MEAQKHWEAAAASSPSLKERGPLPRHRGATALTLLSASSSGPHGAEAPWGGLEEGVGADCWVGRAERAPGLRPRGPLTAPRAPRRELLLRQHASRTPGLECRPPGGTVGPLPARQPPRLAG